MPPATDVPPSLKIIRCRHAEHTALASARWELMITETARGGVVALEDELDQFGCVSQRGADGVRPGLEGFGRDPVGEQAREEEIAGDRHPFRT